jgi:hypothetical protein
MLQYTSEYLRKLVHRHASSPNVCHEYCNMHWPIQGILVGFTWELRTLWDLVASSFAFMWGALCSSINSQLKYSWSYQRNFAISSVFLIIVDFWIYCQSSTPHGCATWEYLKFNGFVRFLRKMNSPKSNGLNWRLIKVIIIFPYFPVFSHVFPYFFSGDVGDIPYISPFDKPKTLGPARWRLGERYSGIANTF